MDPTENVKALSEAANQRQDDLREANNRYLEYRIMALENMAQLRAEHAREIGAMEANRLNSIRQVDVLAVSTAADRAQAAIQALAATTTTNAENLRNALTATATTIATQLANTVAAITERLALLEKSSYEGKGKQAYADPMMAELVAEMKALRQSQAMGSGKSEGGQAMWGYVFGGIMLLIAVASFLMRVGGP